MWKSTPERYGRTAILIHWTSALVIIGLMIAGIVAADMTDPAAKALILRIHVPLGIVVMLLTFARIAWWLFVDTKPKDVRGVPRVQSIAAKTVHSLLYVAVFGLAGSGIGMIYMSGAGDILFGSTPGPLPDFWNFTPRIGHEVFAKLMLLLLLLHVGAALYHQLIRRDRLFARMGVGK
jgi:cytochrome b561